MPKGSQTISLGSRPNVGVGARQRFAPSAIQGLEVLSLPIVALAEYANNMVEENPLLEFDYNESFLQFEELPQEASENSSEKEADNAESFNQPDTYDFVMSSMRTERTSFDLNRLQDDCLETETLKSHLRLQLSSFKHEGRYQKALDEIIESIDDDGYFGGSMGSIAASFDLALEQVEALLVDVQSCTPRGVGARNLGECLLLQIDEDDQHYPVLKAILGEDIDDFAQHKTAQLLKKHHLSHEAMIQIRTCIAELNPRPGAAFYQQQKTTYVIPDLVIERQATGFIVEVTGEVAETMALNKEYVALIEKGSLDDAASKWLEGKQEEAHLVLRNISQRKQTLYRFGLFLAEAQYDFFRFGEARLRPLTMQQVADALSIHVSTVSRTVQDKYVLTPWGTYPLKFFFCSALTCTQSERKTSLSSLAIKNRIKELVGEEDKQKPLSDAALTERLNEEGIEIKRRTVAKYREALGIEKQSRRRW